MKLWHLSVTACVTALLAGCDESGDGQEPPRRIEPPRMPLYFQLNAIASAEKDGRSVECSLDFRVEIWGEMSRTEEVVEYLARMGGGAMRDIRREDGSGERFWADAYYANLQVLHLLPNRVRLVSLDFPPDRPSTGSRFWDELRSFDGFIDKSSVISGDWLCAPLDTLKDDTVFAEGTWGTVELERG